MSAIKTLLELKSKIKGRKPRFIRQDYNMWVRTHKKHWRKPKGIHSKMRHHRKGKRKSPSPGYGSPAKVRGMHHSGLMPVLVENESQIPKSKEYGIILSGRVGDRKKALLARKAIEMGLTVLNIDAEKFLKRVEESLLAKKKKQEKPKEKEAKEKTEARKAEKKEGQDNAPKGEQHAHTHEEDKKKAEKHEKDRLLTKRT